MTDLRAQLTNLTCGDDEIAEAAVAEIAAQGESALPTLLDLCDSPNPEKRWWALRALAAIPHPKVGPQLLAGLRDPSPPVRQCAALGLSQQPYKPAIPALIAALDDRDRLLARLASDALIAAGRAALPELIQTLEAGSQPAQIEAARALAQIGDPAAIPALFAAWQDGSSMVQHWAEDGLDRMGVGMRFFLPEE